MLVNPHNVAKVIESNPNLVWQGFDIPDTQVSEIRPEVFARFPIGKDFLCGLIVPPVGGRGVNVAHDQ
jgi:hypothetical protein